MNEKKESVALAGMGLAACAACCAGPIIGFLGAIGLAGALGAAVSGAGGALVLGVVVALVLRRRRTRSVATCAAPATVGPALVAVELGATRSGGPGR